MVLKIMSGAKWGSEAGGAPLSSYQLSIANLKTLNISTSSRSSRPSDSIALKTMSIAKLGSMPEAGNTAGLNSWQATSKEHRGSIADFTSSTKFTGYNAAGGSHQKVRAPSAVASNNSQETTTAAPSPLHSRLTLVDSPTTPLSW